MKLTDKLENLELKSPEEITEMATLIEAKLSGLVEKSIAFDVLDSEELDRATIMTDVKDGSEYMIAEVPQLEDGVSMVLSRDNQPTGAFLQGVERYTIPFFMISTPRYQKTVQLLRRDGDSIERLAGISFSSILRAMDENFVSLSRASVVATSQEVTNYSLTKQSVIEAMQMVMHNEGYASKILMRKDDFMTLLLDMGDLDIKLYGSITSTERNELLYSLGPDETMEAAIIQSMINGKTVCRCEGLRIILTRYDDVLYPHEAFVFSTPDKIGKMYTDTPKFAIEKRFGLMQWQSELYLGMNFGSVYGVAQIIFGDTKQPEIRTTPIKKLGFFRRRFRRIMNFLHRR